MADSLRSLIRDTLQQAKDPLQPKQPFLVSAEEWTFFQGPKMEPKTEQRAPPPAAREKPKPPPSAPTAQRAAKSLPDTEPAMRKLLQKAAPAIKLVEQIPDDAEAKRIAEGWKEKVHDADVILLLCDTAPETVDFFKGLAKAIDQHLAKAKILAAERLEREKRWDIFLNQNAFRLIVASEGMQQLPELMRSFRQDGVHLFLNKTPLVLLAPASVYKSIEHKAQLWKTLCQMSQ